jgi:hypothetical protein
MIMKYKTILQWISGPNTNSLNGKNPYFSGRPDDDRYNFEANNILEATDILLNNIETMRHGTRSFGWDNWERKGPNIIECSNNHHNREHINVIRYTVVPQDYEL